MFIVAEAKGISANMLKTTSKRRRTQKEIKADKQRKLNKELEDAAKDDEIHALQQQIMQLQEDAKTGELATDMM